MTGLDNLVREIGKLAQDEADRILRGAEGEASIIEEESREKIGLITKEILEKAELEAKSISERGVSGCRIRQRGEMLKLKQDLMRATAEKAKQGITELPDAEYFAMLKALARRTEISGKATVYLNKRDAARDMGDFLESFPKGAEVVLSEAAADISGGFLAVCGGVTVNCSTDALFEAYAEAINHELQRILFG